MILDVNAPESALLDSAPPASAVDQACTSAKKVAAESVPVPGADKPPVVLDTNIILDVFIFDDSAAKAVKQALEAGEIDWIATQPMRDELARVLAYPQIVPRLAFYQLSADDVLAAFDRHARLLPVASKCRLNCSDADDQKFIDLAVARQALLLSKDRHILSLAKRLRALGVQARSGGLILRTP